MLELHLYMRLNIPLNKRTNISSNIAIEARENEVAVCELLRSALLDNQIANAVGEGQGLLPLDGIPVLLAC